MSSGDDWDASDNEAAPTVAAPIVKPAAVVRKGKFADEDVEEDANVKESWEDSDEEAAPKPSAPTGPAPPVRQKGITKNKIAEKEAAEAARLAELAEKASEDPLEKKRREMRLQMQGDLESARSLFGEASISNGAGGKANGLAALLDDGSNPLAAHAGAKTKNDFDAFSEALAKEIIEAHGSKPLYAHFAESLIRALAVPLKDLDVKKCASTLTALGNEKQAAAKAGTGKKGGKGKGKPQLGTVSGAGGGAKTAVTGRGYSADLDVHDQAMDDDLDDFM